jgi:hypothetical protein
MAYKERADAPPADLTLLAEQPAEQAASARRGAPAELKNRPNRRRLRMSFLMTPSLDLKVVKMMSIMPNIERAA